MRRVRGLGSAHHGTEHFWQKRLSGLILLPLALFIFFLFVSAGGHDYYEVRRQFGHPWAVFSILLFTVMTAFHMYLGMQVIIEDYVPHFTTRLALVILNKIAALIVVFAIIMALFELFTSYSPGELLL
jgi:succinate dehydrogenase / fumarate reductase membrane anchor subunit